MNGFLSLIFISLVFGFGSYSVLGCACASEGPSAEIQNTNAVFIGKIVKTIKDKRKWQVEVDRAIKGKVPRTIVFYASGVGTDCENSNFTLNETYIFFANKISSSKVARYENGEIAEGEKEKIGNYEPRTCSWTSTLKYWNSPEARESLKEYKDEKFLRLLKRKSAQKKKG
jgi:hypothetical protein